MIRTKVVRIRPSVNQFQALPHNNGSKLHTSARRLGAFALARLYSFQLDFATLRVLAISYFYGAARFLGARRLGNLLGQIKVSVRTNDGLSFECQIDSISTICLISSWFRESDLIPNADVGAVVDIGAHVGIFSLYASRRFKHSVIVAVEPNPRNYELLLRNLSLNRLENVLTVQAAIMDNDGTTSFWIRDSSLGGSAINTSNERPILVPCYRLDTLLRSLGVDSSVLMKLDVESPELTALSGAPESLNRCPVMIIEVDKINEDSVRNLLSSIGFSFLVLDENSHHSNFLCRKVESM